MNPTSQDVSVDDLIAKIRDEASQRQAASGRSPDPVLAAFASAGALNTSRAELLLGFAESHSQVRTQLPRQLDRFPFNAFKWLQRLMLKVYELLFREQRAVGLALVQALRETLAQNRQLHEDVQALKQGLAQTQAHVNQFDDIHAELKARQLDNKHNLLDLERRFTAFLDQAVQTPTSQHPASTAIVDANAHALDAFYVTFEDQFRGTRESVKSRVAIYLPTIWEAGAGALDAPILDIGCGRGEWLELLRENGLKSRGIDLNRVAISRCQALGLDVQEAEAVAYLRSLDDNSLGAITGIHIIEHLPFKQLVSLFDEALRVLKPGGIVIFETPNPENFVVGACNFYLDPTHLNPLPPLFSKCLAELRGFERSEIVRHYSADTTLHLLPTDPLLPGATEVNAAIRLLNHDHFTAPEYAIIGWKP